MIRIADPRPASDHSFAYTSRELDPEGGLYFYRHRHFDPTVGRSLDRDPIGYIDGSSLFAATFVPNSVDPSGTVRVITCMCRSTGWYGDPYPVTVSCHGLASTCCNNACWGGVFWTGNWKIVPGHDAYDDAEFDLLIAEVEIVLCCLPGPPACGMVRPGVRYCKTFIFRAERNSFKLPARVDPYVKRIHWHMGPGKGLMKYHLPYESKSWWKNFINNCRRRRW